MQLIPVLAALGLTLSPIVASAQEPAAEEAAVEAAEKAVIAANAASAAKLMPAADAPAQAVIDALYQMPESRVVFGIDVPEYKAFSQRFLTARLRELLEADSKSTREMPPALDWDPRRSADSNGAPIAEANKVTIRAFEPTGDKATVKATLKFEETREVIAFIFEKEEAQWKIGDIRQEDGTTLLKILEESKKLKSEDAP